MEILIGILIGVFLTAALSTVFWIICAMFNYNEKQLKFYAKLLLCSIVIIVISFMYVMISKL